MADPLLQRVKDVTGLEDRDLADIVGLAVPTVQAYRLGRLAEHLNGKALRGLLAALETHSVALEGLRAELEMLT